MQSRHTHTLPTYPSGLCPKCGHRVLLDSQGNLMRHARNPNLGPGSRKCSHTGPPTPEEETT